MDSSISSAVLSKFMRKEQSIVGSWNSIYRPDMPDLCEWRKSITMIVNKEINIKKLISHHAQIENSAELLNKIFLRRKDKNILSNFNKALISI